MPVGLVPREVKFDETEGEGAGAGAGCVEGNHEEDVEKNQGIKSRIRRESQCKPESKKSSAIRDDQKQKTDELSAPLDV
jgi:hypothetical protein